MTESILKQEEIARYIGNILTRLRTLERQTRTAMRTDELEDGQQSVDGNPQENRFIFYPTIVQSIINDTTFLAARAIPDANTPWVIDPDFSAKPLIVTAPAEIPVPDVSAVVGVFFTGTFSLAGVPTPRYGLFGAGGGGAWQQTILTSVGDDHLVTRSFVASVVGPTDILVAKNFKNRRTPFDGITRDGLSYVYSTAIDRVVTIAASVGFEQIETIIPRYNLDDIIYITDVEDPTDVTVMVTIAGTLTPVPVIKIDTNNDNREFVRTGIVV